MNTHHVDFGNLDLDVFDSQIAPRVTTTTPSQYIRAQPDTGPPLPVQADVRTQMASDALANTNEPNPAPTNTQQTILTISQPSAVGAGSRLQFAVPGSNMGTGVAEKGSNLRCALCTEAECDRRHDCEGRGNRSYCRCGHPPLPPGKKVRKTEATILKNKLAQQQAAAAREQGEMVML